MNPAGPASASPRLIFHIGAEKTGTTSFQRFCYDHRDALRARGLLYPAENLGFSGRTHNHAPLVAAYLKGDVPVDLALADVWRSREEALGSLLLEIERAGDAQTVLISAEHFSSRFPPHQAERLRRDFERFKPRVVIVLRSHLAWLYSLYSATVRHGGQTRYDDLIRGFLEGKRFVVAFRALVERWLGAFGAENIAILHLREGDDIVELMARSGVIPSVSTDAPSRYRDNARDRAVIIEAWRRINAMVGSPAPSGLRTRMRDLARANLLRSLAKNVPQNAVARPDYLLCADAGLQRALDGAIADDADWLLRAFRVDLCAADKHSSTPVSVADIDADAALLLERLSLSGRVWLQIAEIAQGHAGSRKLSTLSVGKS